MVLAFSPRYADAQRGPGQPDESEGPGWPQASVGAHFGYDQSANGEVVGVQIRIPVLPGGQVELMPNASVTFVTRLREYQYNVDAVWLSGGRQGGPYLGGGLAIRNSIFGTDPDADRESIVGYGAVVGIKAGGGGAFGTQVEFRWIFLPGADFEPRMFTLGANFALPLWGGSGSG